LLTRVFPDAEFESGLGEFTGRLATMPTGAIGANKMLLNYGRQNMVADSLDVEARTARDDSQRRQSRRGARVFGETPLRFTGR
jgi:enoyl-CoA hydratase/carnithine racemase